MNLIQNLAKNRLKWQNLDETKKTSFFLLKKYIGLCNTKYKKFMSTRQCLVDTLSRTMNRTMNKSINL